MPTIPQTRPSRLHLILAVLPAALLMSASAAGKDAALPTVSVEAPRSEDGPDSFRRVVNVADLDLASAAGQATLWDRARRAARGGCALLHKDDPVLAALHMRGDCVRASLNDVRPQVEEAIRIAAAGGTPATQVALAHTR